MDKALTFILGLGSLLSARYYVRKAVGFRKVSAFTLIELLIVLAIIAIIAAIVSGILGR